MEKLYVSTINLLKARKYRHFILTCLVLCSIADIWLIVITDLDPYPAKEVFYISTNLVTLLVTLIISVSCLPSDTANITGMSLYAVLAELTCFACFWDTVSWIVDRNPALAGWNQFSNTMCFLLNIALASHFWNFLLYQFDIKSSGIRKMSLILFVLVCLDVLMIITNPLTGVLFTIENGTYTDGPMIMESYIVPLLCMAISIWVIIRADGLSIRNKVILILFPAGPLVDMLFQSLRFNPVFSYMIALVSLLLIYVYVFLEQNRMLARERIKLTESELTVAKQEAVIADSNAKIMLSQIRPHFLYNSLVAIQSIEGNPPETVQAIADFGKYLRGNIDVLGTSDLTDFEKELEHVDLYLKLEKLRFGDKLQVLYDIEETDFDIPALTVQMLVENAIKHGITKGRGEGTVKLSTRREDGQYIITVEDDGIGFDPSDKPDDGRVHVGLENSRARLKAMCSGQLVIESSPGHGTKASIIIPGGNR